MVTYIKIATVVVLIGYAYYALIHVPNKLEDLENEMRVESRVVEVVNWSRKEKAIELNKELKDEAHIPIHDDCDANCTTRL